MEYDVRSFAVELLVCGQNTVVDTLERVGRMAFAEGGELGVKEERLEDLVAEFRGKSEEWGGRWAHGY